MSRAALSLLPVAALLLLVGQAVAESDKVVKLGSDYEDAVRSRTLRRALQPLAGWKGANLWGDGFYGLHLSSAQPLCM